MLRKSAMTPERLVRSASSERYNELTNHLSRFTVFPGGDAGETSPTLKQLVSISPYPPLAEAILNQTDTQDNSGIPVYDVSRALEFSIDHYINEAKKFADCFGACMLLDVIYITKETYKREIQRRSQLVSEYEGLDHETLTQKLTSLQSQLDHSRRRMRITRSKPVLRRAGREYQSTLKQIRKLLQKPSRLEYHVELSGSVVARLGLFLRALRKRITPQPTSCQLKSDVSSDYFEAKSGMLQGDPLKKLKKPKRVNFDEKPVLVHLHDSESLQEHESIRLSIEIRSRPTFNRSSDSYQRGKWADHSGNGFIDTSGYTLELSEWQLDMEIPALPKADDEPVSPKSVPISPVTSDQMEIEQRQNELVSQDTCHEDTTPPNSPRPSANSGTPEIIARQILNLEPLSSDHAELSAYSEYRRLSSDIHYGHNQRTRPTVTYLKNFCRHIGAGFQLSNSVKQRL